MVHGRATTTSSRRCAALLAAVGSAQSDSAVFRGAHPRRRHVYLQRGRDGRLLRRRAHGIARRLRRSGVHRRAARGRGVGRARALPRRAAHRRAPRRPARRGRLPHPRAPRRPATRRRGGGRGGGAQSTVGAPDGAEAALGRAHMGAAYALDRRRWRRTRRRSAWRRRWKRSGCSAQRSDRRSSAKAAAAAAAAAASRRRRASKGGVDRRDRVAGAPSLERSGLQLQARGRRRRRRRRRGAVRSSARRRRRRGHANGEPAARRRRRRRRRRAEELRQAVVVAGTAGARRPRSRATGVASPPSITRNSPLTFRWCASSLTRFC